MEKDPVIMQQFTGTKTIAEAIIALEDMYDPDEPERCYAGYTLTFDKAAERLKSLRPKSQWKPRCFCGYVQLLTLLELLKKMVEAFLMLVVELLFLVLIY